MTSRPNQFAHDLAHELGRIKYDATRTKATTDEGVGFNAGMQSAARRIEKLLCGTPNLECGGVCCLPKGHDGGCECVADEPGLPGTCPA